MHLCWVTLYVKDMKESQKFYEEVVGLEVQRTFTSGPDMHFTFLGTGETEVELIHDKNMEEVDIGKSISFGFEVENLEEKLSFMKERGIPLHSGPFSPNPNMKFFFVLDPNGLMIQFVENI
ncbi:MAG: VOC family protein [Tissierellia bacterium]|nr:VOC family protein [Tissierellia bacterium]